MRYRPKVKRYYLLDTASFSKYTGLTGAPYLISLLDEGRKIYSEIIFKVPASVLTEAYNQKINDCQKINLFLNKIHRIKGSAIIDISEEVSKNAGMHLFLAQKKRGNNDKDPISAIDAHVVMCAKILVDKYNTGVTILTSDIEHINNVLDILNSSYRNSICARLI